MAFIFNMRSTPISSMHRRSTSSLPVINEEEALAPITPPAVPPRAWNRPSHKHFGLGTPPAFHSEGSPPAYNQFDAQGVEGPNGEKLQDVRRRVALGGLVKNRHIVKRGGWRRIAIVTAVLVLVIIGVAVGVSSGLKNRKASSSNTSQNTNPSSTPDGGTAPPSGGASGSLPPSNPNPATNTTFPAGSYSITTFLDTVSTNCTSAPSTWTCFPYSTYAQSRANSAATFDWVISPVSGTSDNYTISSTQNYFSILFANTSLVLLNKGKDDEHYFFQTTLQKPTKPSGPLGPQNVQATCYFNSTTFQAYLYTKMPKSYPPFSINSTNTSTSNAQPFAPWPYAVKVEEVVGAGVGTPDCFDPSGNSLGDFSVSDRTQLCDCLYLNTGT